MREVQDHYFREAKREGYRSRAAYKLIEIDDRKRLLKRGAMVLDCGCAPGSWLQVITRRIGAQGCAVGIDLHRTPPVSGAQVLVGDLAEVDDEALRVPTGGRRFDIILSDMAPKTTGDRLVDHHGSVRLVHLVLDRAQSLLAPGGTVVAKVLEGEAYPDILTRCREEFEKVKGFKPKASRSESTEMFVIAEGRLDVESRPRSRAI